MQMLSMQSTFQKSRFIAYEDSTLEDSRSKEKFFTRKRKMTFPEILMLILKGINTATQTALDRFFSDTGREEMTMSQQAFSKARSHFDHSPFLKMFKAIVEARYCGEHEIELMHGYQILAIDGSDIALPDMPDLLEAFGGTGRNSDSPTAKASLLYDVVNDFILDAELNKAGSSEREMALRHMEKLEGFCIGIKKLLIFDRGYPSAELIEELESRELKFLMRVRTKWNCAVDAAVSNTQVQLREGSMLRVVRFELPSGEEEVLITNLYELAEEEFPALYFKRWPIEIKYDVLKNKLQVENFSGYSKNTILQDFWASMHVANMVTVVKDEMTAKIQKEREGKKNKYVYVANLNHVISTLREYLLRACFSNTEEERNRAMAILSRNILKCVVPIRPGRSVPRPKSPRKSRFHHNRKLT